MIRTTMKAQLRAACAFLALAAGAAPAAGQTADQTEVYLLRFAREVADGRSVISTSHDSAVARGRRGDRSMMLHDIQAGAVTVERTDRVAGIPLISRRDIDGSHGYDYRAQRAAGTGIAPLVFNQLLRPLLAAGPPLGQDAQWRVQTDLAALGIQSAQTASLAIELRRTYLTNAGQPVVLVEFEIPAFSYRSPGGESHVHWARGFAVTDAEFSEIHALGTQHRASATDANGEVRPISVRTSLHGIDRSGSWRMRFADAPAIRAAVDRALETAGDRVTPVTRAADAAPATSFAASVAARIDFAAFALGENGVNPVPATLDANVAPTLQPAGAALTDSAQAVMDQLIRALAGGTYPTPEAEAEWAAYAESLRASDSPPVYSPGIAGFLGIPDPFASGMTPQEAQAARERATAELMAAIERGRQPAGAALTDSAQAVMDQLVRALAGGTYPTPEAEAEWAAYAESLRASDSPPVYSPGIAGFLGIPDPFASGMTPQEAQAARERATAELTAAIERGRQLAGSPTDQLDALVSQMARQAEADADSSLRLVPPNGLDDGGGQDSLAAWLALERRRDLTLGNEQDTLYRLLRAELERELTEARRDERRRQQREESGIDSLDEFVENNAFDYTSMVGIVATDLSRWGEWLATQNVRELERLARLAGYPNLASALADSQNLIRYAEDPGYRRWAMPAPSCGGYVGCGPSYLERWWMRQSTVLLGDILAQSRDIFSSGGFTDIGISTLNLAYLLRDHALQDGDIVQVQIQQFGRTIFEGRVNLTNLGDSFRQPLNRGVASLVITAENEGFASPNTAQIRVDDVVRGEGVQTYSLRTGESATLRIEAGAGQ